MLRFSRKEMKLTRLCDGDIARYMPQGASRDYAVTDILSLNVFIQQMRNITGESLGIFHSSGIRWDMPEDKTGFFTWVKHPGKTPSGKQPKYGETLYFFCGRCLGEVHYQKGIPSKAKITYWTMRNMVLTGHCKMINGALGLWKIEAASSNGRRETLWSLGTSPVIQGKDEAVP